LYFELLLAVNFGLDLLDLFEDLVFLFDDFLLSAELDDGPAEEGRFFDERFWFDRLLSDLSFLLDLLLLGRLVVALCGVAAVVAARFSLLNLPDLLLTGRRFYQRLMLFLVGERLTSTL